MNINVPEKKTFPFVIKKKDNGYVAKTKYAENKER
jgi:hypothetical protein